MGLPSFYLLRHAHNDPGFYGGQPPDSLWRLASPPCSYCDSGKTHPHGKVHLVPGRRRWWTLLCVKHLVTEGNWRHLRPPHGHHRKGCAKNVSLDFLSVGRICLVMQASQMIHLRVSNLTQSKAINKVLCLDNHLVSP